MKRSKIEELEKTLTETEYELSFHELVLEIAFDFMMVDIHDFDKKVDRLLKKLGKFVQGDRTYLFKITEEDQLVYSHEWCNKETGSLVDSIKNRKIDMREFPWWQKHLSNQTRPYYIEDVDLMPAEAWKEKSHLKALNIQSTISVPLLVNERICGFIGIDFIHSTKYWTASDTELLQSLAKIVASGVSQVNSAEQIGYMAYHDQLTGLANEHLLEEKIQQAIEEAAVDGGSLNVLFIDLDEFKKINDSLGHQAGDKLLKEFSERLLAIVGPEDTVSRRGGDEFIILLRNYPNEEAIEAVLVNIIQAFKEPFLLNQQEKLITGSIGCSQYPEDGENPDCLVKNADIAMYHAKSLGKNQYQKMTPELKILTERAITLTNDLHYAITREELEVYYQPIVQGTNAKIIGLEALLRWKHPHYGFVSPGEFIPLAEKTRLIYPIGSWVTENVAKQLNQWNKEGYEKIFTAVNFSVHELNQPHLQDHLKRIFKEYSLDTNYLDIEITESLDMNNISETVCKLNEIQEMGTMLTIDDYGKGYSSLSRLKDLNIGKIKIDMSFIQGIGKSEKDETIIIALLSFAESLNLKVVAEGVETKEQMDFLRDYHCDQMQGYYFYRPMPVEEVEKLLIKKSK